MSSNISDNLVIVVGRQFGSGGRQLGKMLADYFSLTYYDKELLSEAARKYGFSREIFARFDEKRPSPIRSLLANTLGMQDIYSSHPISNESIYTAQGNIIRDLASRHGAVFVGRSADYILRDFPNLISIFLHSPVEKRAKALVDRGDAKNLQHAIEIAGKIDADRENFYNYFTGRRWGHADNYHLTLDASLLPINKIFEVVKSFIENRDLFRSGVDTPTSAAKETVK